MTVTLSSTVADAVGERCTTPESVDPAVTIVGGGESNSTVRRGEEEEKALARLGEEREEEGEEGEAEAEVEGEDEDDGGRRARLNRRSMVEEWSLKGGGRGGDMRSEGEPVSLESPDGETGDRCAESSRWPSSQVVYKLRSGARARAGSSAVK